MAVSKKISKPNTEQVSEDIQAAADLLREEAVANLAKPALADDTKYRCKLQKFNVPGHGVVTAEEALADPVITAAILAIPGQNVLVEIF